MRPQQLGHLPPVGFYGRVRRVGGFWHEGLLAGACQPGASRR
jgi:hypothetical protein